MDLYLNVEDFQKSFTFLCYPLEYSVFFLFDGAKKKYGSQERALLHLVIFRISKLDISKQRSLPSPTSSSDPVTD